jgi:aminoglycoside 2'-N-acetyltransferase I
MRIEIHDPEVGWELIQALEADVYTPDVLAEVPWRDVVWSHANQRVIVWDDDDAAPVSHVGLYFRDALGDGQPLRVGGIGGVMTRRDRQGHGYATAAMAAARQVFRNAGGVDLCLLFCEPHLIAFYKRLGWQPYDAPIFVEQPSGRQQFTVTRAMIIDDASQRAPMGEVDLCGAPW